MGVLLSTADKSFIAEAAPEESSPDESSPSATVVIRFPKEYSEEQLDFLYNYIKHRGEFSLSESKKGTTPSPSKKFQEQLQLSKNFSYGLRSTHVGDDITYSQGRSRSNSSDEEFSLNPEEEDKESLDSSSGGEDVGNNTNIYTPDGMDEDEGDEDEEEYLPFTRITRPHGSAHQFRNLLAWEEGNLRGDQSPPTTLRGTFRHHSRKVQSADQGQRNLISPFKKSKSSASDLNLSPPNLFEYKLGANKSGSIAVNLHTIISSGSEGEEDSEVIPKKRRPERTSENSSPSIFKLQRCEKSSPDKLHPVFVPIYLDSKTGQPLKRQLFEPFTFDQVGKKVHTEESIADLLTRCSHYVSPNPSSTHNTLSPMLQLKDIILGGRIDALLKMERVIQSFDEEEDVGIGKSEWEESKSEDIVEEEKTIITENSEKILEESMKALGRKFTFGLEVEMKEKQPSTDLVDSGVDNAQEHISHYNQEINQKMKKGYF